MPSANVVVLTDEVASRSRSGTHLPGVEVTYKPIATRAWGVMAPGALRHHAMVAREVRALCDTRPALVHAVRALPEGEAALLARLSGGTPYVCWCHGEDVSTALSSRELTFLMRRVYGGGAAVIANSRHTRSQLVGLGVKPDKIVVVHPGVDTGRFSPEVDGSAMRRRLAPGADLMLLSVGRLQRRKGHDLAIEAVAQLRADYAGLRYVIVGDGAERANLEALARSLGVGDRVVFAGELPDEEIPACYAACDLFVMPNRVDDLDLEGFGIVFLEAAATGKPTIGGASGGVPEAIQDGVTGFLVGGLDVSELAGRIRMLADSPALRARLGGAGRERARHDFTWDGAARVVADLHDRLAA
jgi:phosphatidylinositol alpha-1,6-mannosyltransferase